MSLLEKAKHEVKQVGLVTLYFFVCFLIIFVLKKLFLAQYDIEFSALGEAVIGALIVGKLVVVLEHTPLGDRFAQGALYKDVLNKSVVYTLVVMFVIYLEHAFKVRHEAGGMGAAFVAVFEHRDPRQFWATFICISVTFVTYNLFAGISRHLGEGGMRTLLFASPEHPNTRMRSSVARHSPT